MSKKNKQSRPPKPPKAPTAGAMADALNAAGIRPETVPAESEKPPATTRLETDNGIREASTRQLAGIPSADWQAAIATARLETADQRLAKAVFGETSPEAQSFTAPAAVPPTENTALVDAGAGATVSELYFHFAVFDEARACKLLPGGLHRRCDHRQTNLTITGISATETDWQNLTNLQIGNTPAPETAEPEKPAATKPLETTETTTPDNSAEVQTAEAEVDRLKAELAAARAKLAKLKKGPTAPEFDADGQPLSAGKKAWLTRVARGTVPQSKPKEPKAPIDPNAPNLTAGQKAALTRQLRKADPNYEPAKTTTKTNATERMNAAIASAFPGASEQYGNGTRVCLS